jgi:hypothetical protein
MKRASADKINEIRDKLKKDTGDYCHIGKRCNHVQGKDYRAEHPKRDLVVHHIDNNNSNNAMYNLTLACQPCNIALHPRSKLNIHKGIRYMRERERERERERDSARSSKLMDLMRNGLTYEQRKNIEGENKFKEWVEGKVKRHGYWNLQDVLGAGAVVGNVSIQTTERWVKKLVSSEGLFSTHTMESGEIVLIFKGKIPPQEITGPSQPV